MLPFLIWFSAALPENSLQRIKRVKWNEANNENNNELNYR
jgi:hypothetical protein